MSPPNGKQLLLWLPLILAVITGAVAWGQNANRISQLEKAAEEASTDHDRIVRIETEIKVVKEGQKELSDDVNKLDEDVRQLESTIRSEFATLLAELRRSRETQ